MAIALKAKFVISMNFLKPFYQGFALLLFSAFTAGAQGQLFEITDFKPQYSAKYQYKFMPDTTKRNDFQNTELLLFFNNEESYCLSAARYYNDSLKIDGYEKILAGNSTQLAINSTKSPLNMGNTSHNYLINKKRTKGEITYFINISLEEMYYIEEMGSVDWIFLDTITTIQGFQCRSAKKRYLGRNYIAFYATSIPIQEGPLKFCGLPGLII